MNLRDSGGVGRIHVDYLDNKAKVASQKLTDLDGDGERDMGGAMAGGRMPGRVFSGSAPA